MSAELSRLAPGALSVEASPAPSSYGESFGWRVPTPMVIAALLWSIALLALLIRGPEPAFATRWAWFWLFSSGLGAVCVVAYLVLVARGVPPDPHRRRLTGGWAFLLSVLLPSPWRP